jgi:hypothetical protein
VPFILVVCEGRELLVRSLSAATRAVLPGREVICDLIGQQFVDACYEVCTCTPRPGRAFARRTCAVQSTGA